ARSESVWGGLQGPEGRGAREAGGGRVAPALGVGAGQTARGDHGLRYERQSPGRLGKGERVAGVLAQTVDAEGRQAAEATPKSVPCRRTSGGDPGVGLGGRGRGRRPVIAFATGRLAVTAEREEVVRYVDARLRHLRWVVDR